jgi:hypothetical protein
MVASAKEVTLDFATPPITRFAFARKAPVAKLVLLIKLGKFENSLRDFAELNLALAGLLDVTSGTNTSQDFSAETGAIKGSPISGASTTGGYSAELAAKGLKEVEPSTNTKKNLNKVDERLTLSPFELSLLRVKVYRGVQSAHRRFAEESARSGMVSQNLTG